MTISCSGKMTFLSGIGTGRPSSEQVADRSRRNRPIAPAAFSLQTEHVQHRGRRRVPEFRHILKDIGRLTRACQHSDVLSAVHRIADRWGVDAGADIEAPYFLQGVGVIGREGAVQMAEEY